MSGSGDGIARPDGPVAEVIGTVDSPDVIEVLMEADRPQDVLEELCAFADGRTPDGDTRYRFRLICDEFLENIASYAYTEGNGPVYAAVDARDGLRVILIDKGMPFNPLEAEDPDVSAPIEERGIGGCGILISKRFAKSLEYRRIGDWNVTIAVISRGSEEMDIKTSVDGTTVTVSVSGKLDSIGAPQFSQATDGIAKGMSSIVLDFAGVNYVSSAGLRAVLKLRMSAKGAALRIINAEGMTAEVFRTAGFGSMLSE